MLTMFGHLQAEDFVNRMEGTEMPAKQKEHLDSCARCRATWQSLAAVHTEVGFLDSGIPEPDWVEFRSSVRDRLLSRSIQRESAMRRWTGWAIRPSMAWAISLFLAVGVTTGIFLWKTQQPDAPPPAVIESPIPLQPGELINVDPAVAAWSHTALFDDLVELSDAEQEQLRQILESVK